MGFAIDFWKKIRVAVLKRLTTTDVADAFPFQLQSNRIFTHVVPDGVVQMAVKVDSTGALNPASYYEAPIVGCKHFGIAVFLTLILRY